MTFLFVRSLDTWDKAFPALAYPHYVEKITACTTNYASLVLDRPGSSTWSGVLSIQIVYL